MRNLKKLLAVIVTIAMIATFAIPAFASSTAPAASVADADTKAAVERLSALGIVNGFPDGKFHEELTLTREEFTKMLVVALNLNNAATAAKGITKFSDVASDRWSSGYINVGVSKGIIKGYGNGKFGPADKVKESEAITMLVRALGYKDAWLEGTWPENMVNKADELGILDGVNFAGGFALRGIAAILLNNTLDKELVTQKGFGTDATWEVKAGSSILKDKLSLTEVSGTVDNVPKIDSTLDADQIDVGADTYTVVEEGVDLNSLLGKDVTALVNSDDEAVYVTVDTDAKDIITGTLVANTTVAGVVTEVTVRTADGTETDYDVAAAAANTVYVDNVLKANVNNAEYAIAHFGTFILNSKGKIAFADAYDWNAAQGGVYVSSVDTAKEFFKGYKPSSATESKIDLSGYDGVKFMGAASKLADLKAGDVAYVADVTDAGDAYAYIYVVRNAVSDILKKTNSDASSVTIGATAYDVDSAEATVSLDSDATIADLNSPASVSDAIGETVKAYIDIKGQVRHLVADVNASSAVKYGIITRAYVNNAGDDVIKVFDAATGTSASYVYDAATYTGIAANQAIAFTLDSDNAVSALTVINAAAAGEDAITAVHSGYSAAQAASVTAFNADYDYMTIAAAKKYIADDTLIVDASTAAKMAEPEIVKWADIKDKTVPATPITASYVADGNVIKYIVFTANYTLTSDYAVGVVTSRFYDGDQKALVDIIGDATDKEYVLNGVAPAEKDVIIYSLNGSGEINGVAVAVHGAVYASAAGDMVINTVDSKYDVINATVTGFSSGILDFTPISTTGPADVSFKLTSSVEVYTLTLDGADADTMVKGDLGDLTDGQNVKIITNDDGEPVLVVIVK